jgi:hypothetical protein
MITTLVVMYPPAITKMRNPKRLWSSLPMVIRWLHPTRDHIELLMPPLPDQVRFVDSIDGCEAQFRAILHGRIGRSASCGGTSVRKGCAGQKTVRVTP